MDYSNTEITKTLAEFVESFDHRELDSAMVLQVKRALIDYFCAAITGSKTEVSQMVLDYLLENEGEGPCKVIGSPKGLSKANAAFINGTSAHCLDFDDGHTKGSVHPGTVVIPAVLAVSQALNSSPQKIMASIVVGYEICLRISSAMHPFTRQRGFHNTPVSGIFGAAAAVSYLYGFNANQIQHALGIAGSFCGGTFAFLGTGAEVKRIHPGQAARDGIIAAELAKKGLTGPTSVLEGKNGFFQAFTGNEFHVERLTKDLGSRFEISEIYFKPYPCCRHLHVAIDVVQEMKRLHLIDPKKIQRVTIGVNKLASLHDHKECKSLLDAQMSLPYAISVALLNERLSVPLFDPQSADEEVWNLGQKIEIYVDEEAERIYPAKRAARVEIFMQDGQHLSHFQDNPLGEPSRPLSDEQLQMKFIDNCSSVIGDEGSRQFLESIHDLLEDPSFLYQV